MNVKFINRFLLILAIVLTSISTFADTGSSSQPNPSSNGSAVLSLQKKDPDIKRMPSRNVLELQYADGMLSLVSNSYEGDFSVVLVDTETAETFVIPFIYVGETISIELSLGVYYVTANSTDGTEFTGTLEISF